MQLTLNNVGNISQNGKRNILKTAAVTVYTYTYYMASSIQTPFMSSLHMPHHTEMQFYSVGDMVRCGRIIRV